MKSKGKTFRYSASFKQEVLSQVSEGNLTVVNAGKYYGIPFQTIYNWMKKKKIPNPSKEVYYMSLSKKNDVIKRNEDLLKENQNLKDAISKLTLDNICLKTLVDLAKSEYNIDLKKNSNTKVSKKSEN